GPPRATPGGPGPLAPGAAAPAGGRRVAAAGRPPAATPAPRRHRPPPRRHRTAPPRAGCGRGGPAGRDPGLSPLLRSCQRARPAPAIITPCSGTGQARISWLPARPAMPRMRGDTAWMAPNASPHRTGTRIACSFCGVAVGVSVGISRTCFWWPADPLVDHLPDLLVQLVLLPDAVRGPQQHRRDRHQPDRPADRRIDPLVAPQADAQLTLIPWGEDHGQRVGDPQQVAPQAFLARLH